MVHVYRQVVGLKAVTPILLAFKRENSDRFPLQTFDLSAVRIFGGYAESGVSRSERCRPELIRMRSDPFGHCLTRTIASCCTFTLVTMGSFGCRSCAISAVPTVVSFHGADVRVNLDSPTARRLLLELFASCTLVLARSESLASSLLDLGCPPTKLRIQRTGIPLDTFRYLTRHKPADGAWRLLQACRLIAKKGLESTLRAFATFSKIHPNASLTIAGEGPLRGTLEELAARLRLEGRITFAGFVDQSALLDLYRESHLFLHPSEQAPNGDREGIPNSLLEAMATGLPCITTRHGGIPEAVTHMESGILVGESDPEGIEDWLDRLVRSDELRDSLGRRAAQTIAQKFDLKSQIEKLDEIYLSLCNPQEVIVA